MSVEDAEFAEALAECVLEGIARAQRGGEQRERFAEGEQELSPPHSGERLSLCEGKEKSEGKQEEKKEEAPVKDKGEEACDEKGAEQKPEILARGQGVVLIGRDRQRRAFRGA